ARARSKSSQSIGPSGPGPLPPPPPPPSSPRRRGPRASQHDRQKAMIAGATRTAPSVTSYSRAMPTAIRSMPIAAMRTSSDSNGWRTAGGGPSRASSRPAGRIAAGTMAGTGICRVCLGRPLHFRVDRAEISVVLSGHERPQALVVLGARGAPLEVRAHVRDQLVGGLPGELELDVAVELLEAGLARQLRPLGPHEPVDQTVFGHGVMSLAASAAR